jgi:hypothetical protein
LLPLGIGNLFPSRGTFRIPRLGHFFWLRRQVRIEGLQHGIINPIGNKRQSGKKLTTLLWKGVKRSFEDVIALLD